MILSLSVIRLIRIAMPSQAEMIGMIKNVSEKVMESLKILLLLLVSLAEVHTKPQQVPEDQANHLQQLMSEVQNQRSRIEEISQVLRQQRQSGTSSGRVIRNPNPAEFDSDLEWEGVSNPPPSLPPSSPQPTRTVQRRGNSVPTSVGPRMRDQATSNGVMILLVMPKQAPSLGMVAVNPNIESWGQKCISWGKKWPEFVTRKYTSRTQAMCHGLQHVSTP